MRTSKFFLPIVAALAVLLALASCTYRRSALDMEWDYTPGQRDSIKFVHTHHYSQNYNFKVHADSLMLLSVTPDDPVRPFVDTVYVHTKRNCWEMPVPTTLSRSSYTFSAASAT